MADPKADLAFVKYWTSQLDTYWQEFKNWESRCDKIIQRYRDDRAYKSNGETVGGVRFNALWSNIQTLQPAIYIKPPKPVIERRYLDKDTLARFASMTVERSLEVTIEQCGYHDATKRAVMDYLLCGRGVTWDRYEPTYGTPQDLGPKPSDDESTVEPVAARSDKGEDTEEDGEQTEAPRPVTWEKTYTDYVNFKNFRHSPSPTWEEVTWVAKRDFLTRKELRTRFKKVDPQSKRPVADLIPLETDYQLSSQERRDHNDSRPKSKNRIPRAPIWEIWDKTTRKVIFIAPGWEACALEVTDDPLGLQEFWPVQKPLYATTTNDTLVPVPDYVEYQDQAQELDSLTARINALTEAVRVNGIYDASIPELKRILQEGTDNRMIGVAKYAELSAKGGLEAAVQFLPLKDIASALIQLYDARDRVKADMAEITGLSDIIRGQAQGSTKTATEQKIKGQFATLRLQDRQAEIARFCRDGLAIAAEIISEQYSPEILAQMTGMIAFIAEEIRNDPKSLMPMLDPREDAALIQQIQVVQAQMGHNGGPPMGLPDQLIEAAANVVFLKAVALLKDDKMRTFRIDIETNSTIEVDRQAEKETVVEMFTAMGGFLEKAALIGAQIPETVPALGQSMLFAFRRFGVGRDVEGAWEQAIDKLVQKAKNPPAKQPSPEEIKAKAEMEKQQMESQRAREEAQRERERAQADMAMMQQKHAMEIEKMQLQLQVEREKLAMERERIQLKGQEAQMNAQIKQATAVMDLQASEREAEIEGDAMERRAELEAEASDREAEAGERKHKLGMEVMAEKAKQAKKPKSEARA